MNDIQVFLLRVCLCGFLAAALWKVKDYLLCALKRTIQEAIREYFENK